MMNENTSNYIAVLLTIYVGLTLIRMLIAQYRWMKDKEYQTVVEGLQKNLFHVQETYKSNLGQWEQKYNDSREALKFVRERAEKFQNMLESKNTFQAEKKEEMVVS